MADTHACEYYTLVLRSLQDAYGKRTEQEVGFNNSYALANTPFAINADLLKK